MQVLEQKPGSYSALYHLASLVNRQIARPIPGGSESGNQVWEPLSLRHSPKHDIQGACDIRVGPSLHHQDGPSKDGNGIRLCLHWDWDSVIKDFGSPIVFKLRNLLMTPIWLPTVHL